MYKGDTFSNYTAARSGSEDKKKHEKKIHTQLIENLQNRKMMEVFITKNNTVVIKLYFLIQCWCKVFH